MEYSGLTVGQEYKLTGVLMDKETGEPLLIGEGEEQTQVTSEATFTPAEPNGTIDVLFIFDASALTGKAVVVFETLYIGEEEVTSHTDIEDEGQTVTFTETPKIGTTATVDASTQPAPQVKSHRGCGGLLWLGPPRDLQDVRCPDGQGHW